MILQGKDTSEKLRKWQFHVGFWECLITVDSVKLWSSPNVRIHETCDQIVALNNRIQQRPKMGAQSKTTHVWPLALDFLVFCQVRPDTLIRSENEGRILSMHIWLLRIV